MSSLDFITADEAIEAIKRCAFDTGEVDAEGNPLPPVVHCFVGSIGADWSEPSAIAAVRNAYVHEGKPQIAWMDSLFGRCLVIIEAHDGRPGGRRRLFDTVTPPPAKESE